MSTEKQILEERLRASLDYPHHRNQLLQESGIDPRVVTEREYRTVKTKAELKRLGFSGQQQRAPALAIPMYSPTGELVSHQIKTDSPRTDEKGKPIRYETPANSPLRLDVHPSQTERIKDSTVPLWVTEGVKKGDCLVSHGQCAVALQGVWCWQKGGAALPEWEDIKLHGRLVYVVFDSDTITKSAVQAALNGLADFLKLRGAVVKVVYLPDGQDGAKQGVDDYLASGESVESLVNLAVDGLREDLDGIDGLDASSGKLPDATEFPVDALPQACQRLVKEAAAAIGCPSDFIGLPMLVALGSAIGNSRILKLKEGWEESAILYGAVIAEPGEKKTPAMKEAVKPASRKQTASQHAYCEQRREYLRKLREHEVEKKNSPNGGMAASPEEPTLERMVVEDTTAEALLEVHSENPRGVLMCKDELTGWVRSMDQYKAGGKGADRQFWISAWSSHLVCVDRRSRSEPLMLQRPFVNVIGSIQPERLPELGRGRGDGMLDRFLFAYPEPVLSRWSDNEISSEARVNYQRLYDGLRQLPMRKDHYGSPDPVRVEFAPNAKEVFKHIVNEHREEMEAPGFSTRLKGPWSKLEAYLARLCLILALSRSVEEGALEQVEKRDVLLAMALLDYFKNQARRVYIGLHGENPDDRLVEDVATFLERRGGHFMDEPTEFHRQLESEFKPPQASELSKKLREIAHHTPTLDFKDGNFWKRNQSRRYIELTLRNSVKAVNAVKDDLKETRGELVA